MNQQEELKNFQEHIKTSLLHEMQKPPLFTRIFAWKTILKNIVNFVQKIIANKFVSIFFSSEYQELQQCGQLKVDKKYLEYRQLELIKEKEKLKGEIEAKIKENQKMLTSISEQTRKLSAVFAHSSSKKGKIIEYALEFALETVFINQKELYTTNLQVAGRGCVEFAIRATKNDKKWTPLDSKGLILNDIEDYVDLLKRIKKEAKKISKYLGTNITTNFGILVLPSDQYILELTRKHAEELDAIMQETNVYIASPYSFRQFLVNIVALDEKTDMVIKQAEIIDVVNKVVVNIEKMLKALDITHTSFNKVFKLYRDEIDPDLVDLNQKLNRN